MSYIFSFKDSKVGFNPGGFLVDFPRVPMLDETDIDLSFKAKKGVIEAFDPRFDSTWTFDGPAVGKKTKTVDKLRDKLLSEVTFEMREDDGLLKMTIDGVATNDKGAHPDLTLDLFLTNEFSDLSDGGNRWIGSDFDDFLYGGDGNDKMYGGKGDDSLSGGSGEDVMFGGAGNDRFLSNDKSKMYGGAGDDNLFSGASGSKLYGGGGDDELRSSIAYYDDLMYGGKGADSISGNYGDDKLNGGGGKDSIRGDEGADVIKGQGGEDRLFGGDEDDVLFGGNGADDMDGDDGNDILYGGGGRDVFTADEGADSLFGGKGDDLFLLDEGEHEITGGLGADLFVFREPSVFADNAIAVIKDFQDGVDLLRFGAEFPNVIDGLDDFQSAKDTANGLRLVVEDGWTVFLEGMKAKDISADDFSTSEF